MRNTRRWYRSVQFSRSVASDYLRSHGWQHARFSCPSPTPGACSTSRPSSRWCHPAISSSVAPFSSCLHSSSLRVFFSNQSVLPIRWPKYWSFSINPSNKYSGLISFRIEIKPVNTKEISPEYSLEGLMLKLQYFDHMMWRASLLEKTLIMGKIEGRKRRGQQRMRWLDGITKSMDEFAQTLVDGEWQASLVCCSSWGCKESDTTEWLNNNKNLSFRVWLYTLSRILLALLFWSSSFQAGPKNLL